MEEIMTQDRLLLVKADDMSKLKLKLDELAPISLIKEEGDEFMIAVEEQYSPADVNKMFAEKSIYLSGIKEYKRNLESTFLEIVK
jgi:hypothetical protein